MGLFSWLFGNPQAPIMVSPAPAPSAPTKRATSISLAGSGDFDHEVVGESFYQDDLDAICGGKCEDGHEKECTAILRPEPQNKFDKNAVAVLVQGRKVAHLSRDDAKEFHADMRRLGAAGLDATCKARINGGWSRARKGGRMDEGHYGVELDLEWPLARA